MAKYVLVFAFDLAEEKVVLIRKNRPQWQKGLLNGVGGKIEKVETSQQAAIREFKEETGVSLSVVAPMGILCGEGWSVDMFRSITDVSKVKTMEDEEVVVKEISELNYSECIDNLIFLIPVALDENVTSAEIRYRGF